MIKGFWICFLIVFLFGCKHSDKIDFKQIDIISYCPYVYSADSAFIYPDFSAKIDSLGNIVIVKSRRIEHVDSNGLPIPCHNDSNCKFAHQTKAIKLPINISQLIQTNFGNINKDYKAYTKTKYLFYDIAYDGVTVKIIITKRDNSQKVIDFYHLDSTPKDYLTLYDFIKSVSNSDSICPSLSDSIRFINYNDSIIDIVKKMEINQRKK
jgi:hypothetical protein